MTAPEIIAKHSYSLSESLLRDLGIKNISAGTPGIRLDKDPLEYNWKPASTLRLNPKFIYIDLFCGGGGTTIGLRSAKSKNGEDIVIVAAAVNHDAKAIISHWRNHREVEHFEEDIRTLDITRLSRLIDLYRAFYPNAKIVLWASCECTNLSKAKGGLPRDRDSRTLANDLFRYIEELQPDYIQLENVQEFLSWGPLDENGKPLSRNNGLDYIKWKEHIEAYGYRYDYRLLNAADFGAYTKRVRYFGLFAKGDLPISWPAATHAREAKVDMFSNIEKWQPVKEVLDFDNEGNSILASLKPTTKKKAFEYISAEPRVVKKKNAQYVRLRQIVLLPKAYTMPDIGLEPKLVLTQGHAKNFYQAIDDYAQRYKLKSDEIAFYKYNPLSEKTLGRVYAGLIKYVAGGEKAFFQQAYTGNPASMVTDIHQPSRALTATGGNLSLVQIQDSAFIAKYLSNNQKTGINSGTSISEPAPTVTTQNRLALVQTKLLKKSTGGQLEFITKYYGSGGQLSSVQDPAGALTTRDRMALVQTNWIDAVEDGYLLKVPCDQISRHGHYLMNPQYNSMGNSIEEPCFTLIARMDKAPPHLVSMDKGVTAMLVFNSDSDALRKIKEFMILYGIADIKMRMLAVVELKRIQGFPESYFLAGSQADQKKFIGNAVVPIIPQRWVEAMDHDLSEYNKMKFAA